MNSIIAWLKSLFNPASGEEPGEFEESGNSFAWTEHLRVVLAILVVVLSAFVIWWILA